MNYEEYGSIIAVMGMMVSKISKGVGVILLSHFLARAEGETQPVPALRSGIKVLNIILFFVRFLSTLLILAKFFSARFLLFSSPS